jgi:protein transport protein SEC61 subunit beta
MSATGPSAAGLRKRTTQAGASTGSTRAPAGSQGGTAGGFSVRLYNDASPGFKVGPYFVVMSSVVYLVAVILLHIWGRIGGKS